MKTTTKIFLFAFSLLLLSTTHTLNAQVTIGAEKAPEDFSVLELVGTSGGLRLPQLTTAQRNALAVSGEALAKGLMIYNTDIDCTETWNGTTWVSNCGTESSTFQITRQPDGFFEVALNTVATIHLSIAVEGSGTFQYQWYKQTIADQSNGNINIEAINGATGRTYKLDVTASPDRSNTRYFCEVTNGIETKQSDNARVVVGGCGAYIDGGVWLKFMCHNLGADETADPFTPSARIHGAKYKWGVATPALTQEQDQYSNDAINNWGSITPPPNTTINWDMTNNNPCPSGWRMPTSIEWEQVINTANNDLTRIPDDLSTTWTNGSTNYATGLKIGDSLFFPTVGYRGYSTSGATNYRGSIAYYWSSTYETSARGLHVYFNVSSCGIGEHFKNFGQSVRCVSDN